MICKEYLKDEQVKISQQVSQLSERTRYNFTETIWEWKVVANMQRGSNFTKHGVDVNI